VIGTYFSDSVARCWFLFSDRISDFISIPPPSTPSAGYTQSLKDYVGAERKSCRPLKNAAVYSQQRYEKLKQKVGDLSQLRSAKNPGFIGVYDSLGELLLIDRDRVVRTIAASDAKGFTHGWWIFS